MTRPIDAVVTEALQRLERSDRLDIDAYVAAYPQYADELRELLPVMLTLHQEKRWQAAEEQSRSFAFGLFAQLTGQSAPSERTVGALFHRERTEAGLTLEEQARRAGLPAHAVEDLSQDDTPLDALNNATIKQLAARVSAPFTSLVKEVRRLLSLDALSRNSPQMLFTRDTDLSSEEEQQSLRQQVLGHARNNRPPQPPQKPEEK